MTTFRSIINNKNNYHLFDTYQGFIQHQTFLYIFKTILRGEKYYFHLVIRVAKRE